MGGQSNGPHPDASCPLTTKLEWGVEKYKFQISANRLEIDENVNRTDFRIEWLVAK